MDSDSRPRGPSPGTIYPPQLSSSRPSLSSGPARAGSAIQGQGHRRLEGPAWTSKLPPRAKESGQTPVTLHRCLSKSGAGPQRGQLVPIFSPRMMTATFSGLKSPRKLNPTPAPDTTPLYPQASGMMRQNQRKDEAKQKRDENITALGKERAPSRVGVKPRAQRFLPTSLTLENPGPQKSLILKLHNSGGFASTTIVGH